MKRSCLKRLFLSLLLIAVGFACGACREKPEALPPLKQVVVVGAVPPLPVMASEANVAEGQSPVESASLSTPSQAEASPAMLPEKADENLPVPVAAIEPQSSGDIGSRPSARPLEKNKAESPQAKQADADPTLEKDLEMKPDLIAEPLYSAEGKIDPFEPLVKDEPEAEPEPEKDTQTPKRILTPLEKLDLSQVKLVAVVMTTDGNIAMVEEASGKGYIVNAGTRMGRNGGRVAAIENDRITIIESVKDYKGETVTRSHELILHKSENED